MKDQCERNSVNSGRTQLKLLSVSARPSSNSCGSTLDLWRQQRLMYTIYLNRADVLALFNRIHNQTPK